MKLLYVLIVALVALSNIKTTAATTGEDPSGGLTVSCFPIVEITMSQTYVDEFTKGINSNFAMVIGNNMEECPKLKGENDQEMAKDTRTQCKPSAVVGGMKWTLPQPTFCNPKTSISEGKIIYEYVIHRNLPTIQNAVVRRQACGCIVVQCQYETNIDISSQKEVEITEEKMVMEGKIETGVFDIQMEVKDEKDTPVTNVNLNTFFHIKTKLNKGDENQESYTLSVHKCFVTKTDKKDDGAIKYKLVDNEGCVENNPEDEKDATTMKNTDISIIANKQSEEADIKFKSFVWLSTAKAEQKMYFHCTVQVCANSHKECIDQMKVCKNKRKRRSALLDHAVAPDEHMISLGPITVDKSVDEAKYYHGVEKAALPCSLNNGNCAEVCVNTYGSGHVCACRPGRILNQDGRTCMDYVRNSDARTTFVKVEPAHTPSGSSSDSMFVVAAVAIIAVLNIIGVLLVVSRKGKQFPV